MAIPKQVADRMAKSVKRFQPVLESAKTRDGNESYTVKATVLEQKRDTYAVKATVLEQKRDTYTVKATVLEQKPRVTYTVNVPYTEMKTRLPEQCDS